MFGRSTRNKEKAEDTSRASSLESGLGVDDETANSTDALLSPEDERSAPSKLNAVLSCLAYSLCSVSMVLLNKAISFNMDATVKAQLPELFVVLYQCIIAVVLVESARFFKLVEYPDFNFETARSWLPLNIIFISMLLSGFMAISYVSVPMVTVTKNLTNLVTVFGDWYLFDERVTILTVVAIMIMTGGALMATANDLEFTMYGYFWVCMNCLCTSSYTLYMRFASTRIKLPKFGMVYYNNLLSCFILLPLCLLRNEQVFFWNENINNRNFWMANSGAGVVGFYLNFASLWCVSSTSATTYAIVGSLNKIPITVLGFVVFGAQMTNEGLCFVGLATLGGLLYGYSKLPR